MRILVHSNAPFVPSGYGEQCALLVDGLQSLGHEVVVSAFFGLAGPPAEWHGAKILCSTYPGDPYGAHILPEHFRREKCGLVITLCDIWVLNAEVLRGLPVAHWLPVDCDPLSAVDEACLRGSGAVPVAMSRFGKRMLEAAGLEPLFVPHSLHPSFREWEPDRDVSRASLEVSGKFVIGVNAANKDPYRKGMAETFAAFARLRKAHDDAVMLVHGLIEEPGSLSLQALIARLGLGDAVRFVDQYTYLTGQVPREHLVAWYAALDAYSGAALGEGFGLPPLEAQSLGVPVVVTDASAMTEMCGSGWKVPGEPFWNVTHRSWWVKPDIGRLHAAYEKAYRLWKNGGPQYTRMRARAREFAEGFEAGKVLQEYWVPALAALEERFAIRPVLPAPHDVPALPPAQDVAAPQEAGGEDSNLVPGPAGAGKE